MTDNLQDLSLLSLEKSAEIQKQRQRVRVPRLKQRTFQGVDAEQGQLILGDSAGGRANTTAQGSLSNGAITMGKLVSPYGSDAATADWVPTNSAVGGENIKSEDIPKTYEEQEQEENPDDVPEGTPPLSQPSEQPQYCQCKRVWIRPTVPDLFKDTGLGGSLTCFNNPPVAFGEPISVANGTLEGNPLLEVTGFTVSNEANTCAFSHPNGYRYAGQFTKRLAGTSFGKEFFDVIATLAPTPEQQAKKQSQDWQYVESCNLPVGYSATDTTVTVTDASGVIAIVQANAAKVRVRCAEEGSP